jgi:hypothetical protein
MTDPVMVGFRVNIDGFGFLADVTDANDVKLS